MEVLNGIFSTSFWYVSMIVSNAIIMLTGLINQGFHIEQGWVKRLISWVMGIVVSFGVFAVDQWGHIEIMEFGDPKWLSALSFTIVVSLAANGIYSIDAIRNWISTWFTKK